MAWIAARGEQSYVDDVHRLLKRIEGNAVGKLVAGAIYRSGHDVIIKSLAQFKGNGSKTCRAIADAEDHVGAAPKGVGGTAECTRDKLYLGHSDNPNTDDDDERYKTAGSKVVGTGLGSKAMVYFTPGEWGHQKGCHPNGAGTLPDEVLLHELIHAVRMVQGLHNPVPTTGSNASYHNDEEFLAIVVCNVYISSKNPSRALVANHFEYSALWSPLNTSKGFVDDRDNYALLDHYLNVAKWPFLNDVANLKAVKFNPLYEFARRAKPSAAKRK